MSLPPLPDPAAQPSSPGPPDPDAGLEPVDWRRLDRRMLLVHPVQEAVRFLPALIAVFVTGRTSDRPFWVDLLAVAVVVAYGMSRWFTTRYRIWGGQIELRTGLLNRKVVATPADRVRTVDVTAPIWHRLVGLAKVEVGTAGGAGGDRIVLDALAAGEADRLRAELLHRAPGVATGRAGGIPEQSGAEPGAAPDIEPQPEQVLVRFDPAWMRYAPLTTSGLVTAAAVWGFGVQTFGESLGDLVDRLGELTALGVGAAVLLGLLGATVGIGVLAVTGYLLSFWDFRLSRHPGGSVHVRRGLLTSRATSIEEQRIRGVEIGQPLGLRLAGAARLHAVTTGLGPRETSSGSAWLTPPAPSAVVASAAYAIVGDEPAVSAPLDPHGPAARRRRQVRAVLGAVPLAAAVALARVWWDWPLVVVLAGWLPLLAAPLVARDRYAALGHLLTPRHLVVRSGCFSRRRDILDRDGVIGVVVAESFFQKRAGLATLTVTTAAGKQGYRALDLPAGRAVEVSAAILPDPVGQFLAR